MPQPPAPLRSVPGRDPCTLHLAKGQNLESGPAERAEAEIPRSHRSACKGRRRTHAQATLLVAVVPVVSKVKGISVSVLSKQGCTRGDRRLVLLASQNRW